VSAVLIVVAVVAVVLVAFLVWRRRARAAGTAEGVVVAPRAESGSAPAAGEAGEAPGREVAARVAEPGAARAEAVEEPEEPAEARAVGVEAGPGLSEQELRSRVESRLDDSSRMLGELKKLASGGGEELGLSAGSVEIMEEGLEEVQALAEREQWSQARDKCEALHAQLSLLLRSARREQAS
jgi:hypothetical protein